MSDERTERLKIGMRCLYLQVPSEVADGIQSLFNDHMTYVTELECELAKLNERLLSKALKFVIEYRYQSGDRANFCSLPNPSTLPVFPTITMPREMVVKFRNDYGLLAEFAAFMCGTTVEKLCLLDMMARLGMFSAEAKELEAHDAKE